MAQKITRAIVVLDQNSGTLRESAGEVVGFDLRPDLQGACGQCRAQGVDLVLAVPGLSETGLAGGWEAFAPGMAVVPLAGLSYLSGAGLATDRLSEDEPATALVSADRRLRGDARAAGLHPAPHPALLPMMAAGQAVKAARIAGPRGALERLAATTGLVPMQFQPVPGDAETWALFALLPEDALIAAVLAGLTVQPLACDPMSEDLVWARIDAPADAAEVQGALKGRDILYAEPGQVLVALGPEDSAEALHIHGGHGHSELLVPDPGLLRPASHETDFAESAAGFDLPEPILEPVIRNPLSERILKWIRPDCASVTAQYQVDLDRYTGLAPLDAAGPIVSRHSAHPDNKRAEAALLADLRAMGYCAIRHDFSHAGQTHSNIIADLPGTGHLRIRPEILERYRKILARPVIDRTRLPGRALADLAYGDADAAALEALPDEVLRRKLEEILVLRPWYPWWKLRCPSPGIGADLVVVGGHFDSTAGFAPGYSAPRDPAPGRDDNGSGLAAVLSLARYFAAFRGKLTHTIRFCFFNAEESGLVGSKAYASHLKSVNAPIRAVFCTDMMGYNSDGNRIFELHAGYTDPAIRDLSVPLATRVAAAAAAYGKLAPAQIYQGTGYAGAPDRTISDLAINRSDHAAFQQQGWGAILGSEDFFGNLPAEPAADPNPNYHMPSDTFVDLDYARDITCAFAKAIKDMAV